MYFSQLLSYIAWMGFSISFGASAAAVKDPVLARRRQPEALPLDLDPRDSKCDPAACASAIAYATGGGVACAVTGPLELACIGGVSTGVAAELGGCYHCLIVTECTPGDPQAIDAACGTPDIASGQLGPNQCIQLSSSVPNPSNTDHVLEGGYTIHCHNTARITTLSNGPCAFPCKNCSQCNNWPNKRDAVPMIENLFEA